MTRPHADEPLGFPHQRMHKVTGSTRPPGVVVMVYTAGSSGPGSAAPADEGQSAEDDRPEVGDVPSGVAHRVGGGLAWTVQVSDPTGRSRCRTPSDAGRTSGPHRCARTLSAGSKVGWPSLQRSAVSRAPTAERRPENGNRAPVPGHPLPGVGNRSPPPGDALADNASLRSMPVAADHSRPSTRGRVRVRAACRLRRR